ncbi:MAG: DUF502 domain-containing protein [Hyphomicrobiaceae bacterium]|nr:DUF502 domain-containing protein [Methyloceanibacter sp.]MDX2317704.1 DUF502 domain-containing protein [Hyphomicrobiaceae bacterium]MDX2449731.1 DUF502 domain-containing protein [Hyphomicrobiaceae bacterium]
MGRILGIFIAGLLALLPIALTITIAVWVAQLIHAYAGPDSIIGSLVVVLGLNLSSSDTAAYFIGFLIILICIFGLGLLVESRMRPWIQDGVDWLMMRIPIVSNVYDLSKRFVAIVDRGGEDNFKSMRPVWCFFGGEGGAAVLALMPSNEPVVVGDHSYVAVLVPSAPVPFGGALIYVPSKWIRPAEGGVERLMSVYVSMGVTPPAGLPAGGASSESLSSPTATSEKASAPRKSKVQRRRPPPIGEDAS